MSLFWRHVCYSFVGVRVAVSMVYRGRSATRLGRTAGLLIAKQRHPLAFSPRRPGHQTNGCEYGTISHYSCCSVDPGS
jgi:hypothetical protein